DVIADDGFKLIGAVIVTGDGSCTNVNVIANVSIAQIGQMAGFGAFTQTRFFHFDEVANVGAFQQLSTGAQTRKRANGACGVQTGIFHDAIGTDFTVVTDDAVFNHTASADFDAVTKLNVTFKDNVSINFYVTPVRQGSAQIEAGRIAQHNA